eukprot:c17687_g1_i1.p1 GENE.c17687_g1_i1~~c17687_g1_i1.p1  ORF type:complete len:435 (+),score=135.75 c17687_g1_i1:95-1399(+)
MPVAPESTVPINQATRDPSMWLGLLQWSLRYQDGTRSSDFQPMSEEDKAWISRFFKDQVVDEPARMNELVTLLEDKNHTLTAESDVDDQVTDAIEELIDLTSAIDNSLNLHKIRKFATVVELLRAPNPQLRKGACSIIATCTQNFEAMQKIALELSVLQYLAHMAVFDPIPNIQAKALFAISSLVRNYSPAERMFIADGNGFQILVRSLCDTTNSRARKIALFLTLHFVRTQPNLVKDVIVSDQGVISEILATVISGENEHDLDVSEGVLQLLSALADTAPEIAQAIVVANATQTLQQRLKTLEDSGATDNKENVQVEIGLLQNLLSKLSDVSSRSTETQRTEIVTSTTTTSSAATVTTNVTKSATTRTSVANRTPFVATHEWQKVQSGQAVPSGLHYRMDFSTGETFAKLIDPNEPDTIPVSQQSIVVVPQHE